ncbi:DUF6054 family protein [[Clostridium] dakarense]|uniref:DUF6054 family protein n=1 Tax=Faecalimicrobium dakarense TaxID=1301100 RepID=UPI0004B4B29F|nr:DUF6054 family protein [[Clostridium] dakarense]
MAKEIFDVIISPDEAQEIINREIDSDLVDYQRYELGDDKFILISLYEKYYFRNDSTAALSITIDNVSGLTKIKAVSTGSSIGLLFIDFGASKNFVSSIKKALKDHIVID